MVTVTLAGFGLYFGLIQQRVASSSGLIVGQYQTHAKVAGEMISLAYAAPIGGSATSSLYVENYGTSSVTLNRIVLSGSNGQPPFAISASALTISTPPPNQRTLCSLSACASFRLSGTQVYLVSFATPSVYLGTSLTIYLFTSDGAMFQTSVSGVPPSQGFTLTVGEPGAPQATFTLSGDSCTVSPSTIAGDGLAHPVTLSTAPCTVTATAPTDASLPANTRYRFTSNPASTFTSFPCSAFLCSSSATYHYQLMNTYQVTANTQPTFDTGLTWSITGTLGGTGGSTVCTIASAASSISSCSGYADYNAAVTIPQGASGAPSNSRWYSSAACGFVQTSGGNVNNCNSYKQWTDTFSAAAKAQNTFDAGLSSIAVTGNLYGSSTTICTIAATSGDSSDSCSGYVDNANAPAVPTTIGGAPANSQWKCGTCSFGSVTSGGSTMAVSFYKQWSTTWQATASAQTTFDSGLSTTVTGTSLGSGVTLCIISPTGGQSTGSCSVYIDSNQGAALSTTMSGAGVNTQWKCSACASSTVTSGGTTQNINYYKQLQNTYKATPLAQTTWDSGVASLNVAGTLFGSPGSTICPIVPTPNGGAASCTNWADYNTLVTLPSQVGNPPANSRWQIQAPPCALGTGVGAFQQTTGGNIDNCNYYKQYQNSFAYSVTGGGTFNPPSLTCAFLGSSTQTSLVLNPTLTTIWCDSGSTTSVTNPLTGTSATGTERGQTNTAAPTITGGGATTTNFAFYNQFQQTLSYSISGGGTPSAPTYTANQFGSSFGQVLTATATGYWFDSSASWTVTPNPLGGSTSTERWQTNGVTAGIISAATTTSLTYYNQYFPSISYSVSGGGAGFSGPTIQCLQFGSTFTYTTTTTPTGQWLDSGCPYSFANPLPGSTSLERWFTGSGASGTISSASALAPVYQHQYSVTFKVACATCLGSPSITVNGVIVAAGGNGASGSAWLNTGLNANNIIASPSNKFQGWSANGPVSIANPGPTGSSTTVTVTGTGGIVTATFG